MNTKIGVDSDEEVEECQRALLQAVRKKVVISCEFYCESCDLFKLYFRSQLKRRRDALRDSDKGSREGLQVIKKIAIEQLENYLRKERSETELEINRLSERKSVHVRVPATSANMGPGFDCVGIGN